MSVSDSFIERLRRATNDHDLDGLVSCFAPDFRNETPAHPARSFTGREQVRRNWQQIFSAIPDLSASVTWIATDNAVWSEWEMRGTRRDGSLHLMRGVVVFELVDDLAASARFYLEPVDQSTVNADQAVRQQVMVPTEAAERT